MAWVSPSSRTTGTLITAAIWNQDVVDNPLLLKTPVTDGGNLRFPGISTTTTTGSEYAYDPSVTDFLMVTAGDVTVLLGTTTASSTGRVAQVKNFGSGTVTIYGSGVAIDGSTTSSLNTLSSGEELSFYRWRSSDWVII